MFIDIASIATVKQADDPKAVPAELRDLTALLAWRRHAQEAVVPVMATLEPPAFGPELSTAPWRNLRG